MLKIFSLLVLFSFSLFSWEAHYLLTYQALKSFKPISSAETIAPESLESFVQAEKLGLVNLLNQIELVAKENPSYPPLPSELFFTGTNKNYDLAKQFLMALRLNPDVNALYILEPKSQKPHFLTTEVSDLPLSTLTEHAGKDLRKILPGQKVSPLAIVATGSEEPDHGLDFNLWSDNKSWYKDFYNFGAQPFGNPLLSFGSQAPFHMGFFHETPILYVAGAFLKRCYPEYRITQFTMLSRFAFATGHPYWGYRFLGNALHYLQDLTQVYHSRVAPDMSVPKLIGINLLAIMGFDKLKRNTTQILSNKHLGFESYQLGLIQNALQNQNESAILKSLADESIDKNYRPFSHSYARKVVAKEAYDRAAHVDELIKKALPAYLLDPKVNFVIKDGPDLFLEVKKNPNEANAALDQELITLMGSFGAHTRKLVAYVLGSY